MAAPASCSFCAKTCEEVAVMFAGPVAYICDECIDCATTNLAEYRQEHPTQAQLDATLGIG